jgi:arabinofuranosyltransferase
VALGFLPFLAWEAFSVLYYGFPFPNTAYAKLGAGIAASEIAARGGWYLVDALRSDPVLAGGIALGVGSSLVTADRRSRALAAGVVLYLLYVVKVGGDFMSGRFLTAPFVLSLGVLARIELERPVATAALAVAAAGLVLAAPVHPWATGPAFGIGPERDFRFHGISDERSVYYPYTGLLRATRAGPADVIQHPWVEAAMKAKAAGPSVVVFGNVGFFGYFAGHEVHFVDPPALVDPLLARLPATPKPAWRIGHLDRTVPAGYVETLSAGTNVIEDPKVRDFYEHLRPIVRDPIWSGARLREVLAMNFSRKPR